MIKALVICDDYWHPARTVHAGLAPLTESGVEFDWIEDSHDWSAEHMNDYPVVILSKSNNVSASNQDAWMTPEVEEAFAEYVRSGNGLLAIHSGTAGYTETTTLRALLGGIFIQHPPQCPVTIIPKEGQFLADVPTFSAQDEHYFMALDDAEADICLLTTSEHGTQPGGWTRTEGEGRVCVLTPGHNVPVWLDPSYQIILDRLLRWCARI
jgi:type 1 glutamine amidotransferase